MRDEFYSRAQQVAEEHLMACDEALDGDGDTPAYGPYCGCHTCMVREVLHAALPVIEEGVREEQGSPT